MSNQIEFADDGGTPGWRAKQAAARSPSFFKRLSAVPLWKKMLFMLAWGLFGPIAGAIVAVSLTIIFNPDPTPANMVMIDVGAGVFVILAFIKGARAKLGYPPYSRIGR